MNKKVCSFPILFALLTLLIGTCAVVFPASAQAAPTSTGSITVSGTVASSYDAYQICPMRACSSSRFLTRMRFGLRSVSARAVRTVEGICAATSANKNARGSEPGHLTTSETGRPRS